MEICGQSTATESKDTQVTEMDVQTQDMSWARQICHWCKRNAAKTLPEPEVRASLTSQHAGNRIHR